MKKRLIAAAAVSALMLALTACGGNQPAATTTTAATTAAPEAGIMSHADYVAADLETEVKVYTYVQAKQGWWENEGQGVATFYTQAQDGAYFLYNMPCSKEDYDKLTTGTKIKVTGFKTEWEGEVEIIDAKYETISGDTFTAAPFDVTSILADDSLIEHQNELVSFKGMKIEAKRDADGKEAAFLYNWDGSGEDGSDLYFDASVGGKTYTFTITRHLYGPGTEVYEAVKNLKVGDTVDMEGFLYWYKGMNPHITSVTKA